MIKGVESRVSNGSKLAVCIAIAMGGWAFAASGQGVTYYDLYKTADYTQNSAGQPSTPDYYYFSAPIYGNGITNASLTDPVFNTYPLTEVGPTASGTEWLYQDTTQFADQASLDAAYPDGSYGYQVDTTSGSGSVSLTLSGDYYSTSVPYFTGNTYSELQNADPNTTYTLTWNQINLSSGANLDDVFLTLYDYTAGTAVSFGGDMGNSTLSYDLPAGTLQAGDTYALSLYFSERQQNIPANSGIFTGATSIAAYDDLTSVTFTAVPEPGSLALLTAGGALLLFGRRSWRRLN